MKVWQNCHMFRSWKCPSHLKIFDRWHDRMYNIYMTLAKKTIQPLTTVGLTKHFTELRFLTANPKCTWFSLFLFKTMKSVQAMPWKSRLALFYHPPVQGCWIKMPVAITPSIKHAIITASSPFLHIEEKSSIKAAQTGFKRLLSQET